MTALRRIVRAGTCQKCAAMTNYVCSACSLSAYYCGPRHILEDWPIHSVECDALGLLTPEKAAQYCVDVDPASPPEDTPGVDAQSSSVDELPSGVAADPGRVARSLYADPLKDTVSLVNVPVIPRDLGDHNYVYGWVPVVVMYVQDPAARTVITFSCDFQPLQSPLVVYFSMEQFHSREQVNGCVITLTNNYDPAPRPWYGPLLIMKATADPVVDFCDIEVDDLAVIRSYFGMDT